MDDFSVPAMEAFSIAFITFLGLALGSFATALSWRLPREVSILTEARSRCPACGHVLGVADLVPILSWIFLRGKCRHCQARIGWRYPMIEAATLILCLVFYSVYGLKPETIFIFALAPVMISMIDIDLHHKIIPDSLNAAVLLTGVSSLLTNAFLDVDPASFLLDKGAVAAGGAVLYGLGALLLRQAVQLIVKREAMGMGDIKFFTAAGFWLGMNADAAALLMVVAGISGVAISVIWKKCFKDPESPFGPALVIAFVAVLCLHIPAFVVL